MQISRNSGFCSRIARARVKKNNYLCIRGISPGAVIVDEKC